MSSDGSTGSCRIIGVKPRNASTWNQLGQVSDDDVGAVLPQCGAATITVDTDNQAKTTGASGLDARQGIFDHNRFVGGNIKSAGGMQVGIGSRLARKSLVGGHDPVHASGEEVSEPGRFED